MTTAPEHDGGAPLVIAEQGSFAVGGVVVQGAGDGGQQRTMHGDHAYAWFQVPAGSSKRPLVLLHGNGQFSKTWETTPDGRDGYQNLFLRRGFPVYVVDQPRRGRAGRSTVAATLTPELDDQVWFNTFRLGIWPEYFPGVQFSQRDGVLDQYFRQITPNTGPFDIEVTSDAIAALFRKIGPGTLVTHSRGGGVGWFAAMKTEAIAAVVAYEPGSNFPFPEDEVPPPIEGTGGRLEAVGVPLDSFRRLTAVPILIVYGDYIPEEPCANAGQDAWRIRLQMARLWASAVNRHGGDVTLVCLPDIGVHGNTHFPFSDLNNVQVAEHMAAFLAEKQVG